jgi:hypothetical protein
MSVRRQDLRSASATRNESVQLKKHKIHIYHQHRNQAPFGLPVAGLDGGLLGRNDGGVLNDVELRGRRESCCVLSMLGLNYVSVSPDHREQSDTYGTAASGPMASN